MFKIKDIRMLWTKDELAIASYQNLIKNLYDECLDKNTNHLDLTKLKNFQMPQNYSKQPAIKQNLSFFKLDENLTPNDVYDIIRDVSGELIESVILKSSFFHPKKELLSETYELIFRPVGEVGMSHKEVNEITGVIKERLVNELSIEKRW